ncbi:MAG TPA: hypothetical protein VFU59_10940 [Candidatus Eisenbacteria bacterium]|nr:hypothetical protein [Candidatus Eisenbacteria bacterium]
MIPKADRLRRLGGWGAAAFAALLLPCAAAADSITLSWTAPGDDGNSGRAASYELRYSDQPIAGQDTISWWSAATAVGSLPAPQSAGARESFTVSGLTTGLTYYFVLRTSDEVPNVSAFSNVRARLVGTAALATPAGFTAQAASGGGVLLSWQEPASGAGEGYHLYRREGASAPDTLLHTAALGVTSWTDPSAVAGIDYEYRIATYQGAVEGTPAVATINLSAAAIAEGETVIEGYPNPARGSVTLKFRAETKDGTPGRAKIVVFDMGGHRISQLLDGTVGAGEQTIQWLCRSDSGTPVAPGIYNVILDGPVGRSVMRVAVVP